MTDGDTVEVFVDEWAITPFANIKVRIAGIDSPETHMPPGKCKAEIVKGLAAQEFARTLLKKGDRVGVVYQSIDKYGGRIDGSVILPDGSDFGSAMLASGNAIPYNGGKKKSFCKKSDMDVMAPMLPGIEVTPE